MPITINGTTGIAGVDGSAGTPAVQGSDTNTGIFYPAADTVALATGGSERMRVTSSGSVGIGTTSPSTELHVVGKVTATTGVTGYPTIHVSSAGTQTISSGVATKITLTVEDWDTSSDFTSSRFTPSVAGYYQVNGVVRAVTTAASGVQNIYIYKNGAPWVQNTAVQVSAALISVQVSDLVYCNGTTDYIELYAGFNATSGTITINSATTLSACLVRGA
jgi:hypothetical protein